MIHSEEMAKLYEQDKTVMHTPGPWTYTRKDGRDNYIRSTKGKGVAICQVNGAGHSFKEMQANAHLIEAAPDMLEALKRIAEIAPPPDKANTQGMKLDKIYDLAQTAINKAEHTKVKS